MATIEKSKESYHAIAILSDDKSGHLILVDCDGPQSYLWVGKDRVDPLLFENKEVLLALADKIYRVFGKKK